MPDFDAINSALKAAWIKRINDSNDNANWSHIPTMLLRPLGGSFLLKCNYDVKSLKVNIPIPFYNEAYMLGRLSILLPHTLKKRY